MIISSIPRIALIGVRISWDMLERNADFASLPASDTFNAVSRLSCFLTTSTIMPIMISLIITATEIDRVSASKNTATRKTKRLTFSGITSESPKTPNSDSDSSTAVIANTNPSAKDRTVIWRPR